MKAYHGDPAVKEKYITRMKQHMDLDNLRQGQTYWAQKKSGGGRFYGCAVGCTLRNFNSNEEVSLFFPSVEYEEQLGIPRNVAQLQELVFEKSFSYYAQRWPLRFLEAVPVGAELKMDDFEYAQIRRKFHESLTHKDRFAGRRLGEWLLTWLASHKPVETVSHAEIELIKQDLPKEEETPVPVQPAARKEPAYVLVGTQKST